MAICSQVGCRSQIQSSTRFWKYFYDIQVDQGAFADPCIVLKWPNKQVNGKLIPLQQQQHENQLLLGKGLVRIEETFSYPFDVVLNDKSAYFWDSSTE